MCAPNMRGLGPGPGPARGARGPTAVTFSTRSSIIDSAAIAWPKSVTSARLKRTWPGSGGLVSPGGGMVSTDVMS